MKLVQDQAQGHHINDPDMYQMYNACGNVVYNNKEKLLNLKPYKESMQHV